MIAATIVMTAVLAVAYAALGVVAWRKPLLARLALRESVRRPVQSAVAVAALMIASAAIMSVNVAMDGLDALLTKSAYQAWGRVDLTVSGNGAFFGSEVASRLANDAALRNGGVRVQGAVELVGSVVDLDRDTAAHRVRLIGYDPAAQRAFGEFTTAGGARVTDGVLLSRSLADSLDARAGDRIRVVVGEKVIDLEVAEIALPQGGGAYGLRQAVFAPNGSLGPLVPAGQINVVRVGAPGEGPDELERARRTVPAVRAALAGIDGTERLTVSEAKADAVAVARDFSAGNRVFFSVFGILIALAGAAMVVNLMLAISEERRPRLAVLRAMGLTRAGQVALALMEGAVYSLAAAVLGLVPGALLGWFLTGLARPAATLAPIGVVSDQVFAVDPVSVAFAFAAGSLITLVTVAGAAIRGSGMTIASAVKDLPDTSAGRGHPRLRVASLAVLAVAGAILVLPADGWSRFVGGFLLLGAAIGLAPLRLAASGRAVLLGLGLSAWTLAGPWTVIDPAGTSQAPLAPMFLGPFALGILAVGGLRGVVWAVGRSPAGGVAQAALRPPLAYLARRPIRTGLGVASIAMVLNVVIASAALAGGDMAEIDAAISQWDMGVVAGRRPPELPASAQARIERQLPITTRTFVGTATWTRARE